MTAATKPKITAIAPWFGGKRAMAQTIAAELGPHSSYFDPFCGSMAVPMAKDPSHHENVNDLHGDLVNLAWAIQDPAMGSDLYRRLRRTLLHEDIHARARQVMMDPESLPAGHPADPDRAYWYFVYSWIGRNGTSGTRNVNSGFCKRWTPHGGHGARRFTSAIESIPAWRRRIRNFTITRMDGFEFLSKIEDVAGVAIYCDPPYLVKGAKYVHDFEEADHRRLAELLGRFERARVVVSYYEHPLLAELYAGWTVRRIEVTKAMAHQGARGKNDTRAVECLLLNGPSYAERGGAALFGQKDPTR